MKAQIERNSIMNTNPAIIQEPPRPEILMDLIFGTVSVPMEKLPILRAGIELQVWATIAAGLHTADEIASNLGADQRGVRLLLDALTVMKLIHKEAGLYNLPDWAEYYLLPGKPTYLGDFVLEWLAWERHGQLAEAIRSGKHPIIPDVTSSGSVSHFIPFYAIRALSPHYFIKRYEDYWHTLQVEPRDGLHVLDLACGVGIASYALAMLHPGIQVTLQDWPAMLDIAWEVACKLGLDKQVILLPGDMTALNYGESRYNVARFGWVTYFFGVSELVNLFRRVYLALSDGGILVIEASLSDEDHCKNEEAVLDGPWLYALSTNGDVYSFMDYKTMLKQAGFKKISQVREDLIKAVR
jgi:ubiquinone/menaquinone biosynthesis C-methylase UbiE